MRRKQAGMALILAGVMAGSSLMSVAAATTNPEMSEREIRNDALTCRVAAEGTVLLENRNGALPIAKGGKIALYGEGAYATYASSIGNAWVKTRNEFVNAYQGFLNAGYDVVTAEYVEAYATYYEENKTGGSVGSPYGIPDALPITQEEAEAAAAQTDTAVYVITRHTAEAADHHAEAHDYYLSDVEREQLELLAATFEKTVVVISSGNPIDTKFFREIEGLDALVTMGYGGSHAGDALVQVLEGTVVPSGKLTDTWAENYEDYPSSDTWAYMDGDSAKEVYAEGIYVGYRYFDTFNVTPAYPFGYGLSYTDFDIHVDQVEADAERVTVTATVTNTGDTWTGKEVVEIYFSAPEGELEKPYQELAAFGKTDELAPGASQTLKISFLTSEMSSYSEAQAAYILEQGDYIIRVGNSSRSTVPAAVLTLDGTVVTEQVSNQTKAGETIDELSRTGVTAWTDGKETQNAVKISLSAAAFETADRISPYDSENVTVYVSDTTDPMWLAENSHAVLENPYTGKAYQEEIVKLDGDFTQTTLLDVYHGDVTLEEFVSSLSLEDLGALIEGVGMTWGGHFDVPAEGVVGITTSRLADRKVSPLGMSDGCSGLTLIREFYTDAEGNWLGMKPQEGGWSVGIEGIDEETLTKEHPGYLTWYQYPTQFGSGTSLAQSWDLELVEAVGKGLGEEMYELGVDIILAPSLNIHRNPLNGRNFEYYSEDPTLAGLMTIAETRGVQSNPGVGVSLKHMAVNNQETDRSKENNILSERTLREIYLKGFEMGIRGAAPMTIMSSYNVNNGVPAANDYNMLEDMVRGEWGFDGLVETDWGGSGGYTIPRAMHDGNDLIMPGGSAGATVISAIADIPSIFEQPVYDIVRQENGSYVITSTGETIDTGYPGVTISSWWGIMNATTLWNDFALDAQGSITIEKEVSIESYETQNIPQIENDQAFFVSLKELADQNDAIEAMIDGETVKVIYHGDYTANTLSLGDVQKSAMRILQVVLASQGFEEYSGETAVGYTTARADRLTDYCVVEKN